MLVEGCVGATLARARRKAMKFVSVARFWTMINGWCRVNKYIGLGLFALLLMLAQGWEAVSKLMWWKH